MLSNLNKIDEQTINFEIHNKGDLKISLINGIRRTMTGQIPIYSIDTNSIIFIKNTSMFDNSFLSHRLGLIPIKNELDLNYDEIKISLNIKNYSSSIQSYYCSDFDVIDEDIFVYEDTLFTKLKPYEEIELECTLTKTTIILAKLSLFIPDEPLITRIWNTVTGTIIYNKDTIKKLATTWYQYSPNNTMILLINDLAHDCELLLQLLKNYRLITIDDEINTSKIIQLINWCQSSSVTPFTRY